MDLTNLNDLKSLLGKFNISLSKRLGQHFLVSQTTLEKIVQAANLTLHDTVLEIGPGAGTLTVELAKRASRVVAVEKDKRLLKPLSVVLKDFKNVEVANDDILRFDPAAYQLQTNNYKLIADIPYNITGEILKKFLAGDCKPSLLVLLVQKEVAERIVSSPGQMSILALSVQYFGHATILVDVPARDFYPSPEVDSAVLLINPYDSPVIAVDEKTFFRLIKVGFSSKRKTLSNNLSAGLDLKKLIVEQKIESIGLKKTVRAQELSLPDWQKLSDLLEKV